MGAELAVRRVATWCGIMNSNFEIGKGGKAIGRGRGEAILGCYRVGRRRVANRVGAGVAKEKKCCCTEEQCSESALSLHMDYCELPQQPAPTMITYP